MEIYTLSNIRNVFRFDLAVVQRLQTTGPLSSVNKFSGSLMRGTLRSAIAQGLVIFDIPATTCGNERSNSHPLSRPAAVSEHFCCLCKSSRTAESRMAESRKKKHQQYFG